MHKRFLASITALLTGGIVLGSATPLPAIADNGLNQAVKGNAQPATVSGNGFSKTMPWFSAGILQWAQDDRDVTGDTNPGPDLGIASGTLGCNSRNAQGQNTRVNQDCTFRRQAEEQIKANPTDPKNLIAGQNDSRIGYNHCGFDYSLDGGQTWGDGLPPFWQRQNQNIPGHTISGGAPSGHTYDFASDPALTFDSQGRAFYSCIVVDVNSNASGVLVTSSPAGAGGSFYNNVPASGSRYVVVEDNNPNISHDKEFIVADSYPGQPGFTDNVYVTWTVFKFDPKCKAPGNAGGYCSSPIYFSRSKDHALTWSTPVQISGSSPACFFGNQFDKTAKASDCNFDQGSDPIVLPDHSIVVVFNNGNTAATDPNGQQLAVRSTDGGNTWSQPVRVGTDWILGEPICDFGRICVPGSYSRTNDFPRIAANPADGHLYATWNDYRQGEFDIILSESVDGGRSWTEAPGVVNPDSGMDHTQPAIDVVNKGDNRGDHVAISYYRTARVPKENDPIVFNRANAGVGSSNSDIYLAGGWNRATPYGDRRVTKPFPAPNGGQAGFLGDYSGLVVTGNEAHPIWADTRNAVPPVAGAQGIMNDEDVFTDHLSIPDGNGKHQN